MIFRKNLVLLSALLALLFVVGQQPVEAVPNCTVPGTHATIQAAIDERGCIGITIAAGTYYEILSVSRLVDIRGAIDAHGQPATIVDGSQNGSVVRLTNQGSLRLTNLKLQNGSAENGGGIFVSGDNTTLLLDNVTIVNNQARNGGGIYATAAAGEFVRLLNKSLVANNTATENGGGIYTLRELRTDGFAIDNNTAGGNGGGIYAQNAMLTMENGALRGNQASLNGGGIYAKEVNASTFTMSLNQLLVQGNEATDNGGGVYVEGSYNTNINGSTVANNTATEGGGVYLLDVSSTGIGSSNISGNKAAREGGGVHHRTTTSNIRPPLRIASTGIEANEASINGAGVYNICDGCTVTFERTGVIRNVGVGITSILSNLVFRDSNAEYNTRGGISTIGATAELTRFTLAHNGGRGFQGSNGVLAKLTGGYIAYNQGSAGGGGVSIGGINSRLELKASLIEHNCGRCRWWRLERRSTKHQ